MPEENKAAPPTDDRVILTRAQLDALQRSTVLLQKLSQGPTKRDFERLVKVIVPEVETTDDIVDAAAKPYVEKVESLEAKITEFLDAQSARDKKSTEDAALASLNESFGRLRSEGLTEKGEEAVRQLMIDRNIGDPMAAFALWERNNPKPKVDVPSSWTPDYWDIRGNAVDRDLDGLFKNPDVWADQEIANVLADLRRQQTI